MSGSPGLFSRVSLALGSVLLLRGSSCTVSYCVEVCDPCYTACYCDKICQQDVAASFEAGHRLQVFELVAGVDAEGRSHETLAWIAGLSVPRATGRDEFGAAELRRFVEGVIGVNAELLDLDPAHGRWEHAALEAGSEGALVSLRQVREGSTLAGSLDFLFDVRGRLLQIERVVGPE